MNFLEALAAGCGVVMIAGLLWFTYELYKVRKLIMEQQAKLWEELYESYNKKWEVMSDGISKVSED